ncbi:uncharacterized protein N7518_005272 [Penicillium psychrosexuale]|uniref:uncharacterized protein n=1 Tax=Penicillium psychrosexuale TaxID=1002107 RepID=UPI00254531B1|nr:uncharacterized protein N7518_005272 [Penicillium psychrosexuale]KAJ5796732.1 hypothetical protein N7518_005272 [Penicillium psychrosexuale]
MTAISSFRYSTGEITTAEAAKSFSWEAPVPVNSTARNFLGNFSDSELEQLTVDSVGIYPDNTADQQEKLQLLLQLLQNKLAKEEAATSPPQSLYEVDYKRWYALWQGIYTLENELGHPQAEETVRMLVEKRPDESNIVPPYMLAEHLVKAGKYKEAEEIARPVCQGPPRLAEAEALVTEIRELVNSMGRSKFGIYQEEEARLNEEMVADLKVEI